jgi:hypothetical protein
LHTTHTESTTSTTTSTDASTLTLSATGAVKDSASTGHCSTRRPPRRMPPASQEMSAFRNVELSHRNDSSSSNAAGINTIASSSSTPTNSNHSNHQMQSHHSHHLHLDNDGDDDKNSGDEEECLVPVPESVTHVLKPAHANNGKAIATCAMYSACSVSMILVNKSLASR